MQTTRAMVIAGAGHVGGRAAQALREFGWRGPIMLIGAEPHLPYERPPLSKALLTGERSAAQCALRAPEVYAAESITHFVSRVEAIDPAAHEIRLADGRRFGYEALLLATGGQLRWIDIPGAQLPGVLGLRTLDDAAALAPRLLPDAHIVVIGGGFIGLEVAASARARGCRVSVVEGAPRLLGRAVPESVGARVLALHRERGVDVRVGVAPSAIVQTGTQLDAKLDVQLADGSTLRADTVVVGVGIAPSIALAQAAGLATARGVLVNAELQTSAAGIYAAGDVAEFPSAVSGETIRQETWHNAETQARTAARNMLGGHEAYTELPWFWSDQYDHQLQVAGEPALGTTSVTRALADGAEMHFYLGARGELVGVSGFGPLSAVAKELKLARMLVERHARPAPALLADAGVKLKSLLSA
jgi:3-phenylpropionate/trans-cinnamate dioxygenase ferredoxin reductase component